MKNEILGKTEEHLCRYPSHKNIKVHKDVLKDLQDLTEQARVEGFSLAIASSFRSFERQLTIWNEKVKGVRPLLDKDSRPIDPQTLTVKEKLFSILQWSAVPGFSRHHWGTDFDIYDAAAVDHDYQLQLISSEYTAGPFTPLTNWLTNNMQHFFRPYACEKGGIGVEPWHISHKNVSKLYFEELTFDFFIHSIEEMDIELKEQLLENGYEVYHNYIINIDKE